jgi:hypothetical protein
MRVAGILQGRLPRFDFPNMADIWFAKFVAQRALPLYAVARMDGWLKDADVPVESIYLNNFYNKTDQRRIVENELH